MIRNSLYSLVLLLVCMASDCSTTGTNPLEPRVWSQLHSDGSNSGFNPVRTQPASSANLKWSVFVGPTPIASPVVSPNGNIYIGNQNFELIGVSPGGQIALLRELATGEKFMTTPAIDRFGDIYLLAYKAGSNGASTTCRLLRFAPNGNILREISVPLTFSSPKIVNDTIFISTPRELIVLDRNLSEITRRGAGGGGDICGGSGIEFLDDFFECITGQGIDECTGISITDLQPRQPSPAITTAPNLTTANEPLIVLANYPSLICFVFRNNALELKWGIELDSDVCDDDRPFFTSPSIVLGGQVVVGFSNGNIAAFDISNGQKIWSDPDHSPVVATASAGLGDLYVSAISVLRYNGNGVIRGEGITNHGHSAPAISLDHVFVSADDGLYTFSFLMDRLSKVTRDMNKFSDPAIDFEGNVYVITAAGFLQAYGGPLFRAAQAPQPLVSWVSPADGQTMSYSAQQVSKVAFDDSFSGDVKIVSNRNGVLCKFALDGAGEGECVVDQQLRLGTHILTVAATDQEGNQRSAQITVEVINTPPAVAITSPPDGANLGSTFVQTLSADISDVDQGAIADDQITWVSDRDGALGSGRVIQKLLSLGTHTLTCTAVDEKGASSSASVTVLVSEPVP